MKLKMSSVLAICLLSYTTNVEAQIKKNVIVSYEIAYNDNTIKTDHFIYKPKDVQKLTIVPKSSASTAKDLVNENVTLSLSLKPAVSVLNIEEILDAFHIDRSLIKIPIKIDGADVNDPQNIFATVNSVEKINVDNNKSFLDIITKMGIEKKLKVNTNEVMIQ